MLELSYIRAIRIGLTTAMVVMLMGFCGRLLGQTGTLEGKVTDAVTSEPLVGTEVKIEGTSFGALADDNGAYIIRNIPVGQYTVKATLNGYQTLLKNQVQIERGVTQLNFTLNEVVAQGEAVEIVGSAYQKTSQDLVSVRTVGIEQIRSNPGGNFDISKVVQALPGVSGSVGFRNDIIVRGGAPNENVFYLDGIEVPNINHFATQGSGGGPVGILNSAFIENVRFQSSGFGAKYDNALSSVLDFTMINGNSERLQFTGLISATEAGLTMDGPLGKKANYIFSVRQSYLQFLFQGIGLPFLPRYTDMQLKVQYNITPKTSLTLISIGAIDRFSLNRPADLDSAQLNIAKSLPVFTQDTYTAGLVLKRLLDNGYLSVALSRNWLGNNITRRDSILEDGSQTGNLTQRFVSDEAETKLRLNVAQKFGSWEVNYGLTAIYATFSNDIFLIQNSLTRAKDTIRGNQSIGLFRFGVHGGISRNFFGQRLKTTFGIRMDGNNFTQNGTNLFETFSPRLSASYAITDKWFVNATTGVYYRLPPYTILGFQRQGFGGLPDQDNRDVKNIRCTHLAGGLEYLPTQTWQISVEGFYKHYDNYPVSQERGISLANLGGGFGVLGNEKVNSNGQGRAYGVEVFTQKKLTVNVYGTASYTLFWSEFNGTVQDGRFIRSAWDNRHLISLVGGYIWGKKQQWDFSAKWRYLGPSPFTPFNIHKSIELYPIQGVGALDWARVNSELAPSFSQVDVRLSYNFLFKTWTMNLFLDIQNFFNTQNPGTPNFVLLNGPTGSNEARRDPKTGKYYAITGLTSGNVLPSIGVRVRF